MAHGDYNCCAICDEKQDYSCDAKTKEEICTDCLISLRNQGLNLLSVDEFIGWVKTVELPILVFTLGKIGYHKCFYDNKVDKEINNRLNEIINKAMEELNS